VVEEHFHTRLDQPRQLKSAHQARNENARLRKQSRKSAEIKSVRRIGNRGVVGVTNPSAPPIQWIADGSNEIFSNKDVRRYKLLTNAPTLGRNTSRKDLLRDVPPCYFS